MTVKGFLRLDHGKTAVDYGKGCSETRFQP